MSRGRLRCPVCRTRRATFVALAAHKADHTHWAPCNCVGYHHPHRPGGGACVRAPYHRLADARRRGASAEERLDALIEDILFNDHSKQPRCKEPPF